MTSRAFTLPEMVLASCITAVLGLAVAGVGGVLSAAHTQTDQVSEGMQSERNGMACLNSLLRKTKLVTGTAADQVLLWTGDANSDKQVSVLELIQIRFNSGNQTLEARQLVFPPTMLPATAAALNVPEPLASLTNMSTINTLFATATYAPYVNTSVLATGVGGFTLSVDTAAPYTRLLTARLTVNMGRQQIQMSGSVLIRANDVNAVKTINGQIVFKPDAYISVSS